MKPIIVMPHYIITKELEDLARQALISLGEEVCIVSIDDGSPLDTSFLDILSSHVIRLKENSGFAVACNTGLEWALSQEVEFIGCANNDIEVYTGWLEALIEPFITYADVGITGLVHSQNKEEAKQVKGTTVTEGGLIGDRMQNGGLWMSTKTVLETVGLFDERFKIGGEEDVDLFLRIRDTYGMKIIMSNKSVFWHKEGATRWNEDIPGFKEKNKQIEQTNYDSFAEKWGFDIRTHGLRFYEEILEK